MTQVYSDPTRESDPHSLPNIETFLQESDTSDEWNGGSGWYWQACSPGCLPDGDPVGPFDTEAQAIEDAQDTD